MRDGMSLAYSLSHDDDVWRWSVYDEDGVTVADGAHPTQAAALAAVESMLRGAGVDLSMAAAWGVSGSISQRPMPKSTPSKSGRCRRASVHASVPA